VEGVKAVVGFRKGKCREGHETPVFLRTWRRKGKEKKRREENEINL